MTTDINKLEFVVRQIGSQRIDSELNRSFGPSYWPRGVRFQVEAHMYDQHYPCGIAWVTVSTTITRLEYIIVADEWRKEGIGKRLFEYCQNYWPNMTTTEPISAAGEALLKAIGRKQAA